MGVLDAGHEVYGRFSAAGLLLWLYGFSFVLVWSFILIVEGFDIGWIFGEICADPWRALFVMACGSGMALGIQLQMTVIGRVGLVLSNSVNATFGILLGTLLSAVLGKLPEGVSYGRVFLTALILICATAICQYSGNCETRTLSANPHGLPQRRIPSPPC